MYILKLNCYSIYIYVSLFLELTKKKSKSYKLEQRVDKMYSSTNSQRTSSLDIIYMQKVITQYKKDTQVLRGNPLPQGGENHNLYSEDFNPIPFNYRRSKD